MYIDCIEQISTGKTFSAFSSLSVYVCVESNLTQDIVTNNELSHVHIASYRELYG